MFDLLHLLFIVFVAIFVKWVVDVYVTIRTFPTGPWGLPLVGYIPWLGKKVHEEFAKLSRTHGAVFSVKLGLETVVVLNDWSSIKATLVDDPKTFSARPQSFILRTSSRRSDMSFNDGDVCRSQRNLVMKCLKDVGVGKSLLGQAMSETVEHILLAFSQLNGGKANMRAMFFEPILNFNWKLIANYNFEDESSKLSEFCNDFRVIQEVFGSSNLLQAYPWLRFVPPNGFGYWKFATSNNKVWEFMKKLATQHQNSWISGNEYDFIDHYIAHIKKHEAKHDNPQPPYNINHMLGSMWDLFLAGVETVSSTLSWGFLYLASHPKEMEKVQEEVEAVVGRHRLPDLNDMPNLPYFSATLMEIHRMSSVVPLAIPHTTNRPTTLAGCSLPQGTTILQNIYAVHHDPQLWKEPEKFNPRRFLDENNRAIWPPHLMPFSIGPRLCIGQSLAEMQLKLILSCLLHRFNFALPPDSPPPTFEPNIGLVLQPQPFSLTVNYRNV